MCLAISGHIHNPYIIIQVKPGKPGTEVSAAKCMRRPLQCAWDAHYCILQHTITIYYVVLRTTLRYNVLLRITTYYYAYYYIYHSPLQVTLSYNVLLCALPHFNICVGFDICTCYVHLTDVDSEGAEERGREREASEPCNAKGNQTMQIQHRLAVRCDAKHNKTASIQRSLPMQDVVRLCRFSGTVR